MEGYHRDDSNLDLPGVWAADDSNHAGGRLRLLPQVPVLWNHATPAPRRLLRILFLWQCPLPTHVESRRLRRRLARQER